MLSKRKPSSTPDHRLTTLCRLYRSLICSPRHNPAPLPQGTQKNKQRQPGQACCGTTTSFAPSCVLSKRMPRLRWSLLVSSRLPHTITPPSAKYTDIEPGTADGLVVRKASRDPSSQCTPTAPFRFLSTETTIDSQ